MMHAYILLLRAMIPAQCHCRLRFDATPPATSLRCAATPFAISFAGFAPSLIIFDYAPPIIYAAMRGGYAAVSFNNMLAAAAAARLRLCYDAYYH